MITYIQLRHSNYNSQAHIFFTKIKLIPLFLNQKYKICISYMFITFSQYAEKNGNNCTLHTGMPFGAENFHWKDGH